MTDSEIIKALEWIIKCNERHVESCNDCPLKEQYPYCDEKGVIDALSLITRQKAEIEILQAKNEELRCVIHDLCNSTEVAKSEARREFAERLHCHCESIINQEWNKKVRPTSWADAYEEFDGVIDNLLKEMESESGES